MAEKISQLESKLEEIELQGKKGKEIPDTVKNNLEMQRRRLPV